MKNVELDLAYNYAQFTRRNIFLTGKAGTGKTTFLRQLEQETQKRMIIVAPTGVAAINAGGVTIHSFFQLAPGMHLPGQNIGGREQKSKFAFSKHKVNILRTLDLLVIDEISMVRCDLLDAIDEVLRRYQNRYKPFGGVQLLMIGDLQQLAPVAREDEWQLLQQHGYTSPYFFGSQALQKTNYTTIELRQVYRQSDPTFVNLLNQVRDNCVTPEALQLLNSRVKPQFHPADDEGYITLTTHNAQASDINTMRLLQLPTQPMVYNAEIHGDFPDTSYPTDAKLTLKIGAQVMFCKNDPQHRFYNGKIGRVVKCDSERVWVECAPDSMDPENSDYTTIEVTAQSWQNTRYVTNEKTGEIREEEIGSFQQIPLRTAWAITIHKSQGLTFDRAIIQADRAFSPGQVYVALSRCRSLEGMVLNTPIPASVIMVDPQVLSFNRFIEQNQPTPEHFTYDHRQCIEEILCDIFDFSQMQTRFDYIVRLCDEHMSRLYPNYVQRLKMLRDEMQGVSEQQKRLSPLCVGKSFQQFIHQQIQLTASFDQNKPLQDRLSKGFPWFLNRIAELLQDLLDEELPSIDNKANREQIEREVELFRNDYELKTHILTSCLSGFTLDAYWDAKAIAAMSIDPDNKNATAKRSKGKAKAKDKPAKEKAPAKVKVAASDDIKNQKLYEALKQWRIEKATQLKVQPFHIMHNATLLALTNHMPADRRELLAIPGIGQRMIEAYGTDLLKLISKFR